MQRDMDLIRQILLKMEEYPDPDGPPDIELENYSHEEIHHHIRLLAEAGFIFAENASGFGSIDMMPERITWEGYEFLDAARNENIWSEFKETLKEKGLAVPFALAQGLLMELIKAQFQT